MRPARSSVMCISRLMTAVLRASFCHSGIQRGAVRDDDVTSGAGAGATLHGNDVMMTGVSKDTRDIHAGDLYVALKGERFDGHQFVERRVLPVLSVRW